MHDFGMKPIANSRCGWLHLDVFVVHQLGRSALTPLQKVLVAHHDQSIGSYGVAAGGDDDGIDV